MGVGARLLAPEGRGLALLSGEHHRPMPGTGVRTSWLSLSRLTKGFNPPPRPLVRVVREEGRAPRSGAGTSELRASAPLVPLMALLLEGPVVLPRPDAHPHLLVPLTLAWTPDRVGAASP